MKENFDIIFSRINEYVKNQVNQNGIEDDPCSQVVNGSGSISFSMPLDGNGKGHYATEQKGWGVTLAAKVKITAPADATFNVSVRSSDGGGGTWTNIKTGQEFDCKLETSFWHKTTVSVEVVSSKPNTTLEAKIDYSY